VSLLGRAALERLADAAFDSAGDADGIEVVVQHSWGGLTRFAGSQIHQNIVTGDLEVRVRTVATGGRIGVTVAHTDDPAVVATTAKQALAVARRSPADPQFPGLAPAAEYDDVAFDEATLAASPATRAAAIRAVLNEVGSADRLEAAGALSTGGLELGVWTTAGQRAYAVMSSAEFTLVVTGPSSSGYANAGGRALVDIDFCGAAARATGKALASADPVSVPPGIWPVVLEPAATATLVQFLCRLGFGGRDWLEGRAFTSGRLGEQVLDNAVTIVDDAWAAQTVGLPFDWEGTPKQRVTLIDRGVLAAVVHDRHTGLQSGVRSTGHGLPAPNPYGPVVSNPIMRSGDGGTVADLVAGLEQGLLVTRFHYTNVIHTLKTLITGMTRDGTFLVQDGRITSAVHNLRFTDSILRACAQVDAVSTETAYVVECCFGGVHCPAVRLPALEFTSATTFG
jgi:PmbA protein